MSTLGRLHEEIMGSKVRVLPGTFFISKMTEIKPGKYQHYKGDFYQVVGIARHSETQEKLVVYQALYDSKKFGANALWVRPLKMFLENVVVDNKPVPRFRFAG